MGKYATGAIPSPIDIRDYKYKTAATAEMFPEEFELEMPKVKNQGAVGSCVAHALSYIVEYYTSKQELDSREMSVGYIYGNRTNSGHTDHGMVVRDAIDAVCKYGDCVNTLFPYNEEVPDIIKRFNDAVVELFPKAYENRFTSFYYARGETAIKSALINYGPVVFSIKWFDDAYVDKDGILRSEYKSSDSYHCMVIYGWNKTGWKIQNSWGTGWGIEGRAIMPYDFPLSESWVIMDEYSKRLQEQHIRELEEQNKELSSKIEDLNNSIKTLEEKLNEFDQIEDLTEEQAKSITELLENIDKLNDTINLYEQQLEDKQKELNLLKQELEEIKIPYQSKFSQFFAKIFNSIANAFYYIFRKVRELFTK